MFLWNPPPPPQLNKMVFVNIFNCRSSFRHLIDDHLFIWFSVCYIDMYFITNRSQFTVHYNILHTLYPLPIVINFVNLFPLVSLVQYYPGGNSSVSPRFPIPTQTPTPYSALSQCPQSLRISHLSFVYYPPSILFIIGNPVILFPSLHCTTTILFPTLFGLPEG